ncbi:MAG: hypothetical protein U0625_05350 [Phycisphaerales bacterium]
MGAVFADPPAGAPASAPPASAPPAAAPDAWPRTLAKPIEIRARLATGGSFAGTLESWDLQTLTGSFGTRSWSELATADLRRVFTQVMDRRSATQTLALAELLASATDGARASEELFRSAAQLGATPEQIDAARTRARGALAARAERDRAERERRLREKQGGAPAAPATPDGAAPAAPTPWPGITEADRTAARAAVRESARAALEIVAVRADPLETPHFLLAGDLPAAELRQWGQHLECAYERATAALGIQPNAEILVGPVLVLAFEKEDSFKLVEAGSFKSKPVAGARSAFHAEGPRTSIVAWRGNDPQQLAATLLMDAARAVLHRHLSAAPLPEWAETGFAWWCAHACMPQGSAVNTRRAQGLAFLRQGGDPARVMASTAAAATWPGAAGEPVGYLLVDLMIAEHPERFAAWVRAVKGGKPWTQALAEDFGVAPAALAQGASTWYRTNDGAPRHR